MTSQGDNNPDRHVDSHRDPHHDPRLDIPEVLRAPVRQPAIDPLTGGPVKDRDSAPIDAAGMGRAWGIALDFVFSVLAGALVGWLIDRWRGWLPVGTIVGLGVGFVSGFIRIIRTTQRQEREEKLERERRRAGPKG
jgi:F0F1-type ATP synthase assembly protein I